MEWLGDVPESWEIVPLKAAVRGCHNGIWGEEPDGENEVACLRVADFDRFHATVKTDDPTVRSVEPKYRKHRQLEVGDLLLEKSGGGDKQPVGFVVLVKELDRVSVCSNFVARMPVRETVSASFLRYVFLHLYHSGVNTRSIKQTTGIQNLDTDHYLSTPFALPPESTQRRIASFLESNTATIDRLIDKKERLIELLEERRTALITKAVTKGLAPDVPMKDSGVEWLGEIPEHWEVTHLKRVTECLDSRRIPLNAEERSRRQGPYPYWGANGVVDHLDDFLFDEPLVLLGEDGAPFFEAHKDVAFSVNGKIWVNNHIHVLRPRSDAIEQEFLTHLLNCVSFGSFIGGSTRDKLTQAEMGRIPVQLPPVDEQNEIVRYLKPELTRTQRVSGRVNEAIGRLKEYRSALITAAVTGKIDVRDHAA